MAAKKKGKTADDELGRQVEELIADVGDDRARLTEFIDKLIENFDGHEALAVAEYIAKLSDALTRQHQVRVAAIKTASKSTVADDDDQLDELHQEIGLPFAEKPGDGSN